MKFLAAPLIGVLVSTLGFAASANAAAVVLYDQDFENPVGWTDQTAGGLGDLSRSPVNDHYGNQPPGFLFANSFTVETIKVTEGDAFDHIGSYQDPGNVAGNFVIGMLSNVQNDLLGLTFDVGSFDFLNVRIDISSLDLDCCGGPFVAQDAIPIFRFTLLDGEGGLGSGTILDTHDLVGTASAINVLDFTQGQFGLDASASDDGLVTLRMDLLQGGYAVFDNLRIASSNTEGDVGEVPVPGVLPLMLGAVAAFGFAQRRNRSK